MPGIISKLKKMKLFGYDRVPEDKMLLRTSKDVSDPERTEQNKYSTLSALL